MNTSPGPQLTPRAVILAIVLAMILAAANTYLGLFAGLTIATAIPAAVVSMAVLRVLGGGHILENNIVQTGASAGSSIAAGVIFTVPALVILNYWDDFQYWWVLGIAGLASTSAWIVVSHQQAEQQRSRNAEFAAAARQGVVTLMSLNFNRAADDVQRIVDNSTGQFKQDFEAQSKDFIRVAEESKVITDATVTATGVKNMTDDTADVLVAAYSTVTNAQGAKEEPRTWRLIVSMARDGGQLKVAKVEFAP